MRAHGQTQVGQCVGAAAQGGGAQQLAIVQACVVIAVAENLHRAACFERPCDGDGRGQLGDAVVGDGPRVGRGVEHRCGHGGCRGVGAGHQGGLGDHDLLFLRQQAQVACTVKLHGADAVVALRQRDGLCKDTCSGVGRGVPRTLTDIQVAILVRIGKQQHTGARVGIAAQGGAAGVGERADHRVGCAAAREYDIVEVTVVVGARVLPDTEDNAQALSDVSGLSVVAERERLECSVCAEFTLGHYAFGQDGAVCAFDGEVRPGGENLGSCIATPVADVYRQIERLARLSDQGAVLDKTHTTGTAAECVGHVANVGVARAHIKARCRVGGGPPVTNVAGTAADGPAGQYVTSAVGGDGGGGIGQRLRVKVAVAGPGGTGRAIGVKAHPQRGAEVGAVARHVNGPGIEGACAVGIGCAGVVEGPGQRVEVDFGLAQGVHAVGVVIDQHAHDVAREAAADDKVGVAAGDVVGVGTGAVAAGGPGAGAVGVGDQVQACGGGGQAQQVQVGQGVESPVIARPVGDLRADDVDVGPGHQGVGADREVGVTGRNLGAGERDAAEQGGVVVQAQQVACHGVAGQAGAQVEYAPGGGDGVVAAQASVADRRQAQLCRRLGHLQVDEDVHGLAGRAGVAGVVKGDGAQQVRACTQTDAGEAESACGGAGQGLGDFFTRVEQAVVVEVVKQHDAGVDLGRAVEHQSRGGSGQAIARAGAHVQAGTECQRWGFALVVHADFEAGGSAFVACQVHAPHREVVQPGGQAAGGVAEGAHTQLRPAQAGDQGGLDAGEGAFQAFDPEATGRRRGGHQGGGGGFGPGRIQGDAVQGVVAVAVGCGGGARLQLSVDIEREPDLDHLGLVEFAVVHAHEPTVGAARLGCDHIRQH